MSLKRLYRIAKWEFGRTVPKVTVKRVVIALAFLAVLGGIAGLGASSGVNVASEVYTVGVSSDSPYHKALSQNPRFDVVTAENRGEMFKNGRLDILVQDGLIYVADGERADAAAAEFRSTVKSFNDNRMNREPNQKAANPVKVTIRYVNPQTGDVVDKSDSSSSSADSSSDAALTKNGGPIEDVMWWLAKNIGWLFWPVYKAYLMLKGTFTGSIASSVSPRGVASPFPFKSLVLALVFFAPLNFVVQAYGSTFLRERMNKRGELMLASPARPREIIAGKTLPYFLTMLSLVGVLSIAFDAGWMGAAAILPFILTFLGAVFLGAMLSRSYKELTFVTIAVSVGLISFGFIPSMFTNIHPIALISPLTIVVEQMQGSTTTATEFLFSTLPLTLVALILFGIGAGLYREEDMFAQKSIRGKILDALAAYTTSVYRVPVVVAALLPLVFVAELLVLPLAIPFPPKVAIVVLMTFVAIIEELGKTLPVYAGLKRGRFPSTLKVGVVTGVFAGVGFFIAEKLTAVVQVVGLQRISVGRTVFGPQLGLGAESMATSAFLILAPVILHVVASTVATIGATRGRNGYLVGLAGAMLVHGVYDVMAVMFYA